MPLNSAPRQLSSLTGLRFYAALAVLLDHATAVGSNLPILNFLGQFGWLGVSFFFVLSGFVLMWSFDSNLPPRLFILRRLTRIYPLHLLTLLLALNLFLIFNSPIGGYRGTFSGTLASVFLIHDWIPFQPDIRQAWNGVSWTLSCEFFFYLCAPYIFRMIQSSCTKNIILTSLILWIFLGFFLLLATAYNWKNALDICLYYPLPRLAEFFFGAVGAQCLRKGFSPPPILTATWMMFFPDIVYYIMAGPQNICPDILNVLFVPGTLMLILAVAKHEISDGFSILHQKWSVFLGDASFSLYMIHALVLGIFVRLVLKLDGLNDSVHKIFNLPTLIIYSVVSIFLAAIVHFFVEIPIRKILLNRLNLQRSKY